MVFGRMKDSALGMGLKRFVNERLGQYGEVRDVKVDTKASRITIEALLKGERDVVIATVERYELCLLYTSPSPRDRTRSRMPSSA